MPCQMVIQFQLAPSITNNVLSFNSWHQFKILWSISLLLVHIKKPFIQWAQSVHIIYILYVIRAKEKSDWISWEQRKVKWILKYRVTWRKGVELQIQKTSRIMYQRKYNKHLPMSRACTLKFTNQLTNSLTLCLCLY